MVIRLNENYEATLNNALLGYVGETNARPVSFEGMEVDGADRYILTIDYGDGVEYEVDITDGIWTPTADILRSAQTVSCQIAAKKLSGQEYILVKKSRIFRLRIGAAIGDTAIPSPDVAMDALDRIDAIGRQAHADMQTAQTAADTATTSADNAAKSATNAGVSADTATQAAERAETAQKSAETSATQAENAKQGAETARTEAVTSQNNAKISAAQASASAQQTTADKTITAGYAKTAKTNADSTATDRQAVQEMAAQVTADKATVVENTAKVAEDRTAAETAAQTAQAVADSLPDDYTTAVEKIAENTAEISAVKLTDKELQRRVDALYDMGNGVTHRFETDSDTAYAKTVPTGAKLMSVKNVGGRSIVFNQLIPDSIIHVTITIDEDVTEEKWLKQIVADTSPIARAIGHKVLGKCIRNTSNPNTYVTVRFGNNNVNISNGNERQTTTENGIYTLSSGVGNPPPLYFRAFSGATAGTYGFTLQLFDLTAMFGSGNEPASVEEFEKIFPADYYPYNEGEIVNAGTESVVEQGKNIFDKSGKENANAYTIPMYYSGSYNGLKIPCENGIYTVSTKHKSGYISGMSKAVYVIATEISTDKNITGMIIEHVTGYGYNADKSGTVSVKHGYIILSVFIGESTEADRKSFFDSCDIQIEKSSTPTAYTPYHRNTYPIPEAIKSLPGYGWSAGTAKNYVDYENKRYVQGVGSVDLGTKNWLMYKDGDYTPFFYLTSISDIRGGTLNFLCPKYQYAKIGATGNASGLYVLENTTVRVRDTAYTDATTFKQAMQGVILYYELATPIVTDISDLIPDDFLRNLTVEAGGSITFKNSNGDNYKIPVPNEEEYVVKLSEVGGSV